MSLHFSNGKLLLKNTTNNQWYFVDVAVDAADGKPHIRVDQTAQGSFYAKRWDTKAVILSSNDDPDDITIWEMGLQTNGAGVVTFSFNAVETPTYPTTRLMLKDNDTGKFYEILPSPDQDTGEIYPELVDLSTDEVLSTLDRPFLNTVAVATLTPQCVAAIQALAMRQVIVPIRPVRGVIISTPEGILGEGGENILGESGEPILGE